MPKLGRFNTFVVPLLTWLVLLIPFAIYQRYYVRAQETYLTEHGFRLLAAVGRQLGTYIDSVTIATNAANKESPEKAKVEQEYAKDAQRTPTETVQQGTAKAYKDYLQNFLPDTDSLTFIEKPPKGSENIFSVEFGRGSTAFKREFTSVPASGRLKLDKGIQARLNFGEDYFDDLLIANANGDVLFQKSGDTTIANLQHLVSPAKPADSGKSTDSKNSSSSSNQAPTFETLSKFSNELEVRVAGEDYKLFLQPFQLSPDGEAKDADKIVLAGLWRTERLHSDSFALPYSLVIWFVLFCVSVGCFAWPFLKINYMARTERLRRVHGWALVLSIFLGTASAILMILNGSYVLSVQDRIDDDLKSLKDTVQAHVQQEFKQALDQLDQLTASTKVEALAKEDWNPTTSILTNSGDLKFKYPYFEIAFWADGSGMQKVKYTVDRHFTPQTPVKDRPFFRDVAALENTAQRGLADPQKSPSIDVMAAENLVNPILTRLGDHLYSLQPLISPTTGMFSTVMAEPFAKTDSDSGLKLQAIVFHPMSLVNPTLPPNFGFAVLARDGTVLFHDNSRRNLSENFVQECKDPEVVQAALFSESEQNLDIVYSGKERRAYFSKLRYLGPEPITLVVFHNTEINRTINIAVILIISVLVGLYMLALVGVGFVDMVSGAVYPPDWIWPRREYAVRYAHISTLNVGLTLLFLSVYSRFSESVLLLLTIGVLFTGIAGTARLLTKKQGPIPNLNWDAPHLTRTYMAAGLSLLGVAILVPCLGFFKFAHDAANELAAKHGQLMVASDLSDRQRRINDYYQDLYVPRDTPKDRSKEHLDRYDDVALSFLSFSPQPKKTPLDGDDSTFQKAFDDWLTWASHLFPYNKLGGEMRMLQFESTNINPAKWIELPDNSFRLEIGDRTIDSRFLDWPGVRNGGWLALGMVWVLVGYWLLNLVDKIFLPESQSPLLLKRVQWSSTKDIDANYLVLSEPHSGRHRRLEAIEGIEWFDLRVDLEQNNDKHVFNEAIVVLDHFDFNIHNRHDNELRLQLVERLLYKQRCRIVLISSMDPAYFLMEGDSSLLADKPDAAAELLSRWTKVMSTFQIVAFESTRSRFDDQLLQIRSGPLQRIAQWIWSECGQTSYLRKLGLVVLHNNHKADRFEPRALSNEVAERAQSYYALLWSSLTAGEHLALYQLAKDGWANPKNERAIRHLQLKGLVRAEPMLRIMNESFRLFVLNAQNEREIADWEGQGAQSSWRSLKFSLIATAVALAAWLFYAQKDLFQSAIGYVVTLGAAATAIANFLGGFKGRPAPKKEAEGA